MLREFLDKCNKQIEDMQTLELKHKSEHDMMSEALVRAEHEITDLRQEMQSVRDDAAASAARAAAMLAASADRPAPKLEAGVKERPQPNSPMQHQMPPGNSRAMRAMVHTQPQPRRSPQEPPRVVMTRNMPLHEQQPAAVAQSGRTGMPLQTGNVEPVPFGVVARAWEMGPDTFGQEAAYAGDSSSHVIGEAM